MEDKFKKMQEAGHNCVDCLIDWIKESKIIDDSKEAEQKILKLFEDIVDRHNVELENFREILERVAHQEEKSIDEITTLLEGSVPKLQKALAKAAEAFREALNEK